MATIFYTVDLKTRVFKIKLEKKTITLKEFKDITNRYNYTFFRAISSDDFSQRQILFYSIDDNEELKGVVELYLRSKPSNDISFNIAPLEKAISHGYVTSRLKSNVSESNNVSLDQIKSALKNLTLTEKKTEMEKKSLYKSVLIRNFKNCINA